MSEKLPDLLQFNSFFYQGKSTSKKLHDLISELLQEHADWNVKIDIKWDKVVVRN